MQKKIKIFVVDDDMFYLNILKRYILNLDIGEVFIFNNGEDCLDRLNEKPDVVFLDYNLYSLSGFDFLLKIKTYSSTISVVMISGQKKIKPAVDCLKHGALDYIEKGKEASQKIKHVLEQLLIAKEPSKD